MHTNPFQFALSQISYYFIIVFRLSYIKVDPYEDGTFFTLFFKFLEKKKSSRAFTKHTYACYVKLENYKDNTSLKEICQKHASYKDGTFCTFF